MRNGGEHENNSRDTNPSSDVKFCAEGNMSDISPSLEDIDLLINEGIPSKKLNYVKEKAVQAIRSCTSSPFETECLLAGHALRVKQTTLIFLTDLTRWGL